jgi:cytochrome c oxidase cbb3-type subunit 3
MFLLKTNTQMVMKSEFKKGIILLFLSTLPIIGSAQKTQVFNDSIFSNALFNAFLVIIIFLLIVIIGLSSAFKNLIQSETRENKEKMNKTKGKEILSIVIIFILSGYTASYAQVATSVATPVVNDWKIGGLDYFTFFSLSITVLMEFGVIYFLIVLIKNFVKSNLIAEIDTTSLPQPSAIKEKNILDKFNASVEIEKEAEIMLDHDYDGIKELNNDLPPWWKYGFYLTIVVAVVYLFNFHIIRLGDLQIAEYDKEVIKAKVDLAEYMKTAANNVDETNVKLLSELSDIEAGKKAFINNCAACHGKIGEGGVGPNVTDKYWIHGGDIVSVFKSVKYGWPDKGMKSWKEDLSPIQLAQVSSYIHSLVGTNPPNGKAPQGDLMQEIESVLDTTNAKLGSNPIAITVDKMIAK